MPLYVYKCNECGFDEYEVIQRITAKPLVKCPQCHKDTLVRKIQATSFVLKGGGWAKDGYVKK
jgi:putative FmdB family regulatory protein